MSKPVLTTLCINGITLGFLVGQFNDVIKHLSVSPKKPEAVLPASLNDLATISESSAYAELYRTVDICTTDGMPLVWWFRRKLGSRIDRLYGPDLMKALIEEISEKQVIVCPAQDVADVLRVRYKNQVNKGRIVLHVIGQVTDHLEQTRLLRLIKREKPVAVWIGVGSPNQIHLASVLKNASKTKTRYFCVGAAVPFLAGKVPQAPKWIQRIGLEWLFRLVHEPRRLWSRYLVRIPRFLIRVLITSLR